MQAVKVFPYRLYPSTEQVARLRRWEGSLRFLWNLAHAQRLTGLARSRDERIFCSAAGQMKELTALRAEVDWLADVPCDIAQATLKTLDNAWQRCFTKLGGRPRFKAEAPGKNVAQKQGLNRSILQMGWGQFVTLLEQKSVTYDSTVVRVPAAYSSQTCAACGHVDSDNRKTQDRFVCTRCQHEEHADINAASVLRQRYEEMNTRRTGGEEVCGGDAKRRPTKQKLRSVRTKTPRKSGAKSSGLPAGDGLPFQRRPQKDAA